jgi:hypothetical protein
MVVKAFKTTDLLAGDRPQNHHPGQDQSLCKTAFVLISPV